MRSQSVNGIATTIRGIDAVIQIEVDYNNEVSRMVLALDIEFLRKNVVMRL
jgi:hypothetical protein